MRSSVWTQECKYLNGDTAMRRYPCGVQCCAPNISRQIHINITSSCRKIWDCPYLHCILWCFSNVCYRAWPTGHISRTQTQLIQCGGWQLVTYAIFVMAMTNGGRVWPDCRQHSFCIIFQCFSPSRLRQLSRIPHRFFRRFKLVL